MPAPRNPVLSLTVFHASPLSVHVHVHGTCARARVCVYSGFLRPQTSKSVECRMCMRVCVYGYAYVYAYGYADGYACMWMWMCVHVHVHV